ncbi:BRO family protein, partial [Bacillus cereus group sp. Bce039]
VVTNMPALGDTFDNYEFESKRDRSQTLEGDFYSSITKSYVNGLVLCGLSFNLLLIKLPAISSK